MKPIVVVVMVLLALAAALLYVQTIVPKFSEAPPIHINAPFKNLMASVGSVPTSGGFDEVGTVVFDSAQGQSGIPYLLYTAPSGSQHTAIITKRLVFPGTNECAKRTLPCASADPGYPVAAGQKVRVIGTVNDDTIIVSEVQSAE